MNHSLATQLLGEQNGYTRGIDIFYAPLLMSVIISVTLHFFIKKLFPRFRNFIYNNMFLLRKFIFEIFSTVDFLDQDYKAIINPLCDRKRDTFF